MGFAVRTLDAAVAPDWGDVVPVYSHVAGPIERAELLETVAAVRGALADLLSVAGRSGTAGVPHRLSGDSLLRSRRRPGLHLRQRPRSRRRLPRHRAERLERHPRRPRSGDGDRRDGRPGASRLQARSRRPLAAARTGAGEQPPAALVRRPFAGRRDGDDLREPLQALVHPIEPARALHLRQSARGQRPLREVRAVTKPIAG